MARVIGQQQGIITELQRCSVHDGPGIRTTVFLKGCNLRCEWCHNPETLDGRPQIEFYSSRCIDCGACIAVCPQNALKTMGGRLLRNTEVCTACGQCVEICWSGAVKRTGIVLTAAAAAEQVFEDIPFYQASRGGVTISGGEPFCQAGFLSELTTLCRDRGVHTAVETNLDWEWEYMHPILQNLDLIIFDVKVFDSEVHQHCTGRPNTRILENIGHMAGLNKPCIVRTPIIPGVNDSDKAVASIAARIGDLPNLLYYELLPFHPFGSAKYTALGQTWYMQQVTTPSPECMNSLQAAAERYCANVRVGGR